MPLRFGGAVLLCLALDFTYHGFWPQNYFFNRAVDGFEFVIYSRALVPREAKCQSNSSPVWGVKVEEKLWTWIGSWTRTPAKARFKVWVLRRLGQLSPALFDKGVAWLIDPALPILILRSSPKEDPQDVYSILRNAVLGPMINEYAIVSCASGIRTEESAFYQGMHSPKLTPLVNSETHGRVGGLNALLQRELAQPQQSGFGLLEVLFPGADAALLSYKAGVFEFYPFTARGGLKIHCVEGHRNCAISPAKFKELGDLARTLDQRWVWILNPAEVDFNGRSGRWHWLAERRRVRACSALEIPELKEIAEAWLARDGADRVAWSQSRDRLCASVDFDRAEKISMFAIRQRKSLGDQPGASEF